MPKKHRKFVRRGLEQPAKVCAQGPGFLESGLEVAVHRCGISSHLASCADRAGQASTVSLGELMKDEKKERKKESKKMKVLRLAFATHGE